MMSLTIDPSQIRPKSALETAHSRRMNPVAKTAALAALGLFGIGSFSVAAYSMLGTLAGPQVHKVTISHRAADWPDLKDGVPALASGPEATAQARPKLAAIAPSTSVTPPSSTAPPITAAAPVRRSLPLIEAATLIEGTRTAPLVGIAKSAALIAPRPAETVRARAIDTTLAALPPENAAKPVRKPAAVARTKPAAQPGAVPVAEAVPAESDETEVLGVKVPSLAASGRRFVEGVQSLGDAVAKQF